MARLTPKKEVLRALFSKSGNKCAFPNCEHPLIDGKNNFVAQVCHIEAAEKEGERYNPLQSDEERRGYDNLILLCYRHHVETNDTVVFSPKKLLKIKRNHELLYSEGSFIISDANIYKIRNDFDVYFREVEHLNKFRHIAEEYRIDINFTGTYFNLVDQLECCLAAIEEYHEMLREYDNKKGYHNWEILNLGLTNYMSDVSVKITQLELLYLREYISLHPNDEEVIRRLRVLKKSFKEIVNKVGYVD